MVQYEEMITNYMPFPSDQKLLNPISSMPSNDDWTAVIRGRNEWEITASVQQRWFGYESNVQIWWSPNICDSKKNHICAIIIANGCKQCLSPFALKIWYVKKKLSRLVAKPTNQPLVLDFHSDTPLGQRDGWCMVLGPMHLCWHLLHFHSFHAWNSGTCSPLLKGSKTAKASGGKDLSTYV